MTKSEIQSNYTIVSAHVRTYRGETWELLLLRDRAGKLLEVHGNGSGEYTNPETL